MAKTPDVKALTTIHWVEESRDPFQIEGALVRLSEGFVTLVYPKDLLAPGTLEKTLSFPAHAVLSVQTQTREVPEVRGYREENTFREEPGSAPTTRGVGLSDK